MSNGSLQIQATKQGAAEDIKSDSNEWSSCRNSDMIQFVNVFLICKIEKATVILDETSWNFFSYSNNGVTW